MAPLDLAPGDQAAPQAEDGVTPASTLLAFDLAGQKLAAIVRVLNASPDILALERGSSNGLRVAGDQARRRLTRSA